MKKSKSNIQPIHPGEILHEEFLEPLGLSAYVLAEHIDVPRMRISEIIRGNRSITPDTALRLGAFFSTSPEFWMNLQVRHDLDTLASAHACKGITAIIPFVQLSA